MASQILRRIALAIVVITLSFAESARAQNPPANSENHPPARAAADQRYRYRLLGVYDETTGEPVEGVEVIDVLNGTKSLTSATGTMSLFFLPDGGSLVRLRKLGYEVQTLTISISPADTNPVTIVLARAVTLPTVTVKDSASHYFSSPLKMAAERMNSHSGGYFLDDKELRKHDESVMSNTLIGRMPGLTTLLGPHGETWIRSSRVPCIHQTLNCRMPDCLVTIYRDGIKLFDPATMGASSRVDFGRLSPMEFSIVEYYPGGSTVPPEYGGLNAPCGVLLLWSRES
ncbi:MAG TPA: hypothetical protein VGM50_08645 [Gemmatimonadaceae bacterium]|jgi:hypothetical protein